MKKWTKEKVSMSSIGIGDMQEVIVIGEDRNAIAFLPRTRLKEAAQMHAAPALLHACQLLLQGERGKALMAAKEAVDMATNLHNVRPRQE